MSNIDVLVITALELEYTEAKKAASKIDGRDCGVESWETRDARSATPYLRGTYAGRTGSRMTVALARPTRMGATAMLPLAATLVERLQPRCLAMCGVCAGNPDDVALGDVIIAEMTYPYDEGKQKQLDFEPDARQTPMLDTWVRAAQELTPDGLPSFGPVSEDEARLWLLEQLYEDCDPRKHPARERYIPGTAWKDFIQGCVGRGLVRRKATRFTLTDKGRKLVEQHLAVDAIASPKQLPFRITVGPIASGNVVVKDGLTWKKLARRGVRSVLGLEMEAAAIGSLAHRSNIREWVVAKGVMDHADPRKVDRYKEFAARASAEVLFLFLSRQLAIRAADAVATGSNGTARIRSIFVVGGVTGETTYPVHEDRELTRQCIRLGRAAAEAGVELIVCSPFPDSADVPTVMGYVESGLEGRVHFHSPRHPDVVAKRRELDAMLGARKTKFIDWGYPGPEDEDSWGQAWLLCQLQALEHAEAVVAIGGRISNTATTLLHLAEARRIPVVPYDFLGGAALRAYNRRDWKQAIREADQQQLRSKDGVVHAIEIANRMAMDNMAAQRIAQGPPKIVFVSRARQDAAFADRLVRILASNGVQVLLGEHELRDDRMAQASIEDGIRRADVCAVLWSRNYAQSMWCFDELDLAISRERIGQTCIWLFNLDGSDIVPRGARNLRQVTTKTVAELMSAVGGLLGHPAPQPG